MPALVAAILPADVYDAFVYGHVSVVVHLWVLLGDLLGDLLDHRDQSVGLLVHPDHRSVVGLPSRWDDQIRAGHRSHDLQDVGCSERQRCRRDALVEALAAAV